MAARFSQQAPTSVDVAICGGGLGGLALAAGLKRRGLNAAVFEAAPELRTATSTLIGLGGNGFKALDILHPDITPKIKERGALATTMTNITRHSRDEEPIQRALPPTGQLVTIRWSEVQRSLAELVPAGVVYCNHKTLGYTEDDEHVTVHFKGQPDVRAKLVVGADGVRSAIRACMVPNDPGPRYLGHMNWNALIHNPGGKGVVDAHVPGELQAYSDVDRWQMFGLFAMVIDAGADYTFWQVRYRSEEPSFTAPPGEEQAGKQQGEELMRRDAMPHLVGGGLGRPGSRARVEQLCREAGFDHVLKVVQATPESAIFERAMMDRVPLDELGVPMHSKGGRVVLLGDAAHAMHSGPGQGGRSAFEDACVLAMLLDEHRDRLLGWSHTSGGSDVARSTREDDGVDNGNAGAGDLAAVRALTEKYSEARLVRTARIQRFATEGCGLPELRDKARPPGLTPDEMMARFREFSSWLEKFPDLPSGDPNSKYWPPPAFTAAVKEAAPEVVVQEAVRIR